MNRNLEQTVIGLQKDFKLTDYEALRIALEVERNNLFIKAHVISSTDEYPSALEKIAMELVGK